MTDSNATELFRSMLDEKGVKWTAKPFVMSGTTWVYDGWWHNTKIEPWGESTLKVTLYDLTPEQAVAATLGAQADYRGVDRLRGIADDMRNIGASSMTPHELFAYWAGEIEKAIGLLEYEQAVAATLRAPTLTAEQVSKAVYAHSIHADCADADWQAIPDELNATLEVGECEKLPQLSDTVCIVKRGGTEMMFGYWRCSECGCENFEGAKHCMNCGRKAVKR